MRAKIIATLVSIAIVACCVAAVLVVVIAPRLAETPVLSASAQVALAKLGVTRVESLSLYSGGPAATTVTGETYNGESVYVFVYDGGAWLAPRAGTITRTQAEQIVRRHFPGIAQVVTAQAGPADVTLMPTLADAAGPGVWQITGRTTVGTFVVAYVDMDTGQILWHFSSSRMPSFS
ncbi:MAG: hypothetical protein OWT27_05520 [Firmicutes bacterium]|nr:hypothetical protein [Bacillota bacterium]